MRSVSKKYTNGEITVFWKSSLCIHVGECFGTLPSVFKPGNSPWIDMYGAPTEDIIHTVNKCPTGALTYKYNKDIEEEEKLKTENENKTMSTDTKKDDDFVKIKVTDNGPYIVEGKFKLYDSKGTLILENKKTTLCSCGLSKKKPFCDGSHNK